MRAPILLLAVVALAAPPARAQEPPVRLAAPADCATNPNCAPGLERTYGTAPPASALVRLTVADAGIQALDDGVAEVAVAFSSDPALSRPDIKVLRDDKDMIGPDRVVPVVRSKLLERYGAGLKRRLNAASRLLNTLALRGLNQQVIDGRLPEAVGGEFVDANGLGGDAKRKAGPQIVVGYQDFAENETLAHLYAEALRAGGYRVKVRAVGGLRRETVAALRRGRIDMWPGYDGSLHEFLGGRTLRAALARVGAEPLRLSQAQNRNVFATKTETARRLSLETLSDLTKRWKPGRARAAAAEPLQDEQWAFAEGSVLDLPGAWGLTQGAGAVVAVVDSGTKLDHPDLAPNIWANFREVPGNGADDDGNGYVDDVYGIDLSSRQVSQNLSDGHGHGTHVAGIIAAAANRRGVVGVAPRAKIMTVRVLDDTGAGTTGAVAEGIRYAAANGARVINASIQGDFPDPNMEAAIAAAGAANALVVVSAGNSARDIDAQPSYPAAIAAPNLVSVAATAPDAGTDARQLLELRPPRRRPRRARRGHPGDDQRRRLRPQVGHVDGRPDRRRRRRPDGVAEPGPERESNCAPGCCSTPAGHGCRSPPATSTRSTPCARSRPPSARNRRNPRGCGSCARRPTGAGRSSKCPSAARRRRSSATGSGSTTAPAGRSRPAARPSPSRCSAAGGARASTRSTPPAARWRGPSAA